MGERRIVVVGAGVAGLTTALLLSKNEKYKITVAAKHMPGDYDIEYASPWAGANFWPISKEGTAAAKHDENTWPFLEDLARNHPEAGIHFQRSEIYVRKKDENRETGSAFQALGKSSPWWRRLFPDFQPIPQEKLKPGMASGNSFTSVCMNTAIYLPWLVSQCLKAGVVFKRAVFTHISDAAKAHHLGKAVHLVVNCTGLGSYKLGGVEDNTLTPARGQIVVVRNEPGAMFSVSSTDYADELMYIMMRAAGGGTVLGGCYQKGNWESQFDPNLANRIMKRCVEMCPQLTNGQGTEELDIIRHGVGLRPLRQDGARIEKEKIGDTWVIHNYGHAGFGYQSSYGCSQVVVELADELFADRAKI